MAEFEEKLGAILNNPQAMSQIMALAQSLGGNSPQSGEKQTVSAASAPSFPTSSLPPSTSTDEAQEVVFEPVTFSEAQESEEIPSFSNLNLDPRLLEMGMKAISAYQDPNNAKAALLQALRPFVKEERYKKVDKAVQIARISKAIRVVLDGFKGGEEVV